MRLVAGDRDTVVSMDQMEALQKALRYATLTRLRDIGHFAQMEAPGQVANVIRSLVESIV